MIGGGPAIWTVKVPVKNRYGDVVAMTLVEAADEHLTTGYKWTLGAGKYARRSLDRGRECAYLHREVMGLAPDDPRQVDHINGVPLDNRRSNLRVTTQAENSQNMAAHKDAKSPYRGVTWYASRNKWTASVWANGRSHFLGYFEDELEAAQVAHAKRLELMPFYNEARPGMGPA